MITCFRISNHSLDEEIRIYQNRADRPVRVSRNWNMGKFEDELHFLLVCPAYEEVRNPNISSK